MNDAHHLIKTLKAEKLTLALAESITCGLAAHKLSNAKGVSDVLQGSVVCYTAEVKMKLLKISKKMIGQYSCESREVTHSMAENLASLIKADIYAAVTGLASEGGSETKGKPVGTVFFSIRYKSKNYNYRKLFRGTPTEIKEKTCRELYKLISKLL